MFRFEHSEFLHGLWIIALLFLLAILGVRIRRRILGRFTDEKLTDRLAPDRSRTRPWIKTSLLIMAFALLILGAANPQLGSKLQEAKQEGIDLMVAFDLSNSMMAEDVKPNRLEQAKQMVSRLVEKLKGDRIGIVVFGGKAYTQLPITSDYAAARLYLSTFNTELIPTQGTAIGDAIRTSMEAFSEDNDHGKAILVISDGENHEDDAIEAAKEANEANVIILTMGIGSPDGGPIPIYRGKNMVGYRKDQEGNTVVTRMNATMLQEVAAAGQGSYITYTGSESSAKRVLEEIGKLQKGEIATRLFTDYEDRFYYLLWAALILLVAETLIPEKRSKWFDKWKI